MIKRRIMSNFIHEYSRAQDYVVDSLYYRYEKLLIMIWHIVINQE